MWWRTMIVLTAACGSSSDPPMKMMAIDAAIDAGCPQACMPTAAGTCPGTQRCNWRVDAMLPEKGSMSCTTSGAVAQNLPCTRDVGGGDNCVKGTTCYMDRCRSICALTGASNCDVGMTCMATMFFVPCGGTMPVAGLCL